MQEMRKDMTEGFENMATKDDINRIHNQLDGIVARLDDDDVERTALESQVNRHDGWIQQIAVKTDTKLAA